MRALLLMIVVAPVVACDSPHTAQDAHARLLFEHEGCRVYKGYDPHAFYWANCEPQRRMPSSTSAWVGFPATMTARCWQGDRPSYGYHFLLAPGDGLTMPNQMTPFTFSCEVTKE